MRPKWSQMMSKLPHAATVMFIGAWLSAARGWRFRFKEERAGLTDGLMEPVSRPTVGSKPW